MASSSSSAGSWARSVSSTGTMWARVSPAAKSYKREPAGSLCVSLGSLKPCFDPQHGVVGFLELLGLRRGQAAAADLNHRSGDALPVKLRVRRRGRIAKHAVVLRKQSVVFVGCKHVENLQRLIEGIKGTAVVTGRPRRRADRGESLRRRSSGRGCPVGLEAIGVSIVDESGLMPDRDRRLGEVLERGVQTKARGTAADVSEIVSEDRRAPGRLIRPLCLKDNGVDPRAGRGCDGCRIDEDMEVRWRHAVRALSGPAIAPLIYATPERSPGHFASRPQAKQQRRGHQALPVSLATVPLIAL